MRSLNSKTTKTLKIMLVVAIVLCFTGIILVACVSSALSQKAEASFGFSTTEKPFAGGDGTQENPYLIANAFHLNNVRYFFYHRNEDGSSNNSQPNHFLQIADVDFALQDFSNKSDANVEPIGTTDEPFPGVYEAQSYSINNVKISSTEQNVGLFGATSSNAKLFRIALKNSTISSSLATNVGALVGQNAGLVEQCYSLATVSAGANFGGGLVGANSGTVKNSYHAGKVVGTKTGGVVGSNSGTILGCFNNGTLGTQQGGIAHTNSGSLSRVAYLSTTASSAVYGGTDSGLVRSLTQNQLSGKEQFSIDGVAMYVTELLNGKNSSDVSSFFLAKTSTCQHPQIWTNAQEDAFKLSGDGTTSSPYLVTSPQVFSLIGKSVTLSELKSLSFSQSASYLQPVDLNFVGIDTNAEIDGNFSPISQFSGTYSTKSSSRCAVIEGVEFDSTSTSMALFSELTSAANVSGIEVKNFVFDIQVASPFTFAGIATNNAGTIKNCVNAVSLTHTLLDSQITSVTSVAGIAISNSGTISCCANLGSLDVALTQTPTGATSFVGGIVSTNAGIIDQCYNSGNIRGGQTGGLVVISNSGSTISNSFNSGDVVANLVLTGQDTWAGGLVCNAIDGSQISNCYNAGKVRFAFAVVASSVTNSYFLSGNSTTNVLNGDTTLALNANQFAGQTAVSTSNILGVLGMNWEFDWTYLGRDGVAYQFPQLKNNKAEYHLSTAMKVDPKGFHIVDDKTKFDGICSTYNSIPYPNDGWFDLRTNIDYSGTSYAEKGDFYGKLYGNGHSISNISINRSSTGANGYLGFFSQVYGAAVIKDLTLNNMEFKNKSNDNDSSNGVLAGKISYRAQISNITVQNCNVRAKNNIGGFAGAISNTSSDGTGNGFVVGCRVINTKVRHDDDGTGSNGSPTGGFVGWANSANISACYYAYDNTSGGDDNSGVWGYYKMGGFVGITQGATTINNCFAYGSIWSNRLIAASSSSDRASVGGFIGRNQTSSVVVSNCYARVTMTKNTSFGHVSSSKRIKGFGYNTGGGTFSNNYCLSGQNYEENDAGATEVSESALKTQSTFSGWDFTNVWTMSSTSSMPYGMPIPIAATQSAAQQATLVVTTDGNSKIQAFSGTTLVGETTSSSFGMGILELGAGSYSIYITRNGQTALNSSNVSNYASYEIEKVDVSLEAGQTYIHQNKWFARGSGTASDPYSISTKEHFEKLNAFAGAGEDTQFVLSNNIDMKNSTISSIKDFRGTLDGAGNQIVDFSISTTNSHSGLFESIQNATLKNVGVNNFSITNSSSNFSGGLVGVSTNSQIVSCFSENGIMSVGSNAGGLVGKLSGGSVLYSYSNTNISQSSNVSSSNIGGLVGTAADSCTIEESYSSGKIEGKALLGGFVATLNKATTKNCYSKTIVCSSHSGNSSQVGGFAGVISADATIQNSFMFGTISSVNTIDAGNFAGVNSSANLSGAFYWNNNSHDAISTNNTTASALPLSTIQLKQASSFDSYDFVDVWGMPAQDSVACGSPILRRVANAFDVNEEIMGSGTELDPYVIFDEQTLIDAQTLIAASPNSQLHFKLQKNITISSSWTGLGTQSAPFVGSFDGNGKTISGLAGTNGLFAYAKNATIKNLSINGADIQSTSANAGVLVDNAENLNVQNVTISGGEVSATTNAGALIGKMNGGVVSSCSASGVSLSGANAGFVGEAIGVEFSGDSVSGLVASGTQNAGGIAGLLTSSKVSRLSTSSNTFSGQNIGGVAGSATSSTIKNVISKAFTASNATNIGGIVGVSNSTTILGSNIYMGSLSSSGATGGVAGHAISSTLSNNTINTRWSSSSTFAGQNVGGVVGHAQNMTQMSENRLCQITLTSSSASGAIGQLYGKLTGNANASKTLFKDITISNSVGATSNALSGVNKTEIDVFDGAVQTVTWTYVE